MKTFLFQGDSITDAGRNRGDDNYRGNGYPTMVAGELGLKYPGEYKFINRGISGDRTVDVYARLKRDITELEPDYMSMLIGVNDVWHELHEIPNGVDSEKSYKVYCDIIEETLRMVPKCKIFILEPFVLKAFATAEHWNVFNSEVKMRAENAKKVAEKYGLPFVPLQELFDEAEKSAPADYWLIDGVHPSPMGHKIIANALIKAFEENK